MLFTAWPATWAHQDHRRWLPRFPVLRWRTFFARLVVEIQCAHQTEGTGESSSAGPAFWNGLCSHSRISCRLSDKMCWISSPKGAAREMRTHKLRLQSRASCTAPTSNTCAFADLKTARNLTSNNPCVSLYSLPFTSLPRSRFFSGPLFLVSSSS